jgi:hypothetical protein
VQRTGPRVVRRVQEYSLIQITPHMRILVAAQPVDFRAYLGA